MSHIRSLIATACVLALAACNQQGAAPGASAPANQVAASGAPANCDAPAVGLAIGSEVSGDIPAAQNYPANARYYCINVGEGAPSLTLELSGMSVDLDLYVGHGSISSVQGVDISAGENYEWKANAFGTGDERVVINQPQPGIYYAEIVSFQGEASPYRFSAR